jgi:hypothetical protein
MHKLPQKWGVKKWHRFGTFFMKKNAKKSRKKNDLVIDLNSQNKTRIFYYHLWY